uniref:Uncharacterized protein n=1 Tax=Daphnia magna TaxID=35525 RepID=A0A0P6JPT4_9CRUS
MGAMSGSSRLGKIISFRHSRFWFSFILFFVDVWHWKKIWIATSIAEFSFPNSYIDNSPLF